jgi:CheY-like chemotaxis protein
MTARVFELGARDKGLKLDTLVDPGVPDALVGDPARLRQVLNNLVGNAIKFTERGQVTVSVTRADGGESDRHGDAVLLHFCVRDTGIGIPPEKQDVIFRAFEQADQSVSRRFGGSGLGLAISARLVRLMNGRIWVESELQRGSAFHFEAWFDLAGAEQGLSSAGESPATSAPGKEGEPLLPAPSRALRLLLVEDNPVNQRLARRLLEKRGHSVRLAGNGREALAALASDRFDAILMDVQMPEMDGFEATAAIRAAERAHGGHIPIVAMTAHAMSGDEERCLAAGMDAYLSKPIEPRHLFALLDELATATANASEPRGGEAPAV